MGGPRAAAAYASSPTASSSNDKRQRLDAAVHSLRKSTQCGANDKHTYEYPESRADRANSNSGSESDGLLSDGYDDGDEDDDYEDFNEDEVRAAAALEHSEMKKHFNFQLEKRQSLKNHFMSAMHKKRRLLMRNENLRFRELCKAPEPMVLLIAASLVTIVWLILTNHHITALHLAVLNGNIEIARMLLEAGAKHIPTKNGTTPLDAANELGHSELGQLLLDHVKKESGKEQIGNWLASIGMVEYAVNFHDAGFDDADFLLASGLSEAALDTMEIEKPGHRMKLQSLYQLKESIRALNGDDSENEEGESGSDSEEDSGESDSEGSESEDGSGEDDSDGGESSERSDPELGIEIGGDLW